MSFLLVNRIAGYSTRTHYAFVAAYGNNENKLMQAVHYWEIIYEAKVV